MSLGLGRLHLHQWLWSLSTLQERGTLWWIRSFATPSEIQTFRRWIRIALKGQISAFIVTGFHIAGWISDLWHRVLGSINCWAIVQSICTFLVAFDSITSQAGYQGTWGMYLLAFWTHVRLSTCSSLGSRSSSSSPSRCNEGSLFWQLSYYFLERLPLLAVLRTRSARLWYGYSHTSLHLDW